MIEKLALYLQYPFVRYALIVGVLIAALIVSMATAGVIRLVV